MSSSPLDLPASWGCCWVYVWGDSCLRQKVELLNLSSSFWLRIQETRFHPLPCQATAEWCWASHLYSTSFCKMGLHALPSLSQSVITKFTWENTRREEMEKLKPLSPRRVLFWFSLCRCLRQLPTSEPCFLQPRSVDVSSSGKFCSGVYTRGFEAIYQTPLPGTALRCWQQVAGSLQMCCLFQQRNIRGGRGEGSLLFLPNHTYEGAIENLEAASSSGTFHKIRVCWPLLIITFCSS